MSIFIITSILYMRKQVTERYSSNLCEATQKVELEHGESYSKVMLWTLCSAGLKDNRSSVWFLCIHSCVSLTSSMMHRVVVRLHGVNDAGRTPMQGPAHSRPSVNGSSEHCYETSPNDRAQLSKLWMAMKEFDKWKCIISYLFSVHLYQVEIKH